MSTQREPKDEGSNDFEFSVGDRVRVRVRENGTSGNIKGKFEAEVTDFESGASSVTSDRVHLDPPWDSVGGVKLKPYDAEFEVLDGDDA